jgi:hypothetical protein
MNARLRTRIGGAKTVDRPSRFAENVGAFDDAKRLLCERMTEQQLMEAVIELAGWLSYLCFHPYDSRRSAPGWPDLVICGHGRCIVAELKRERGRVSTMQQQWLDELALANVEVHIWRPWHWHSGEIERVLMNA